MKLKNRNLTFAKLSKSDKVPYELLLLADPSKELIDEYLTQSDTFIVKQNDEIVGIIVLFPLTEDSVEIKNVAVKVELQGQGLGRFLIDNAVKTAFHKRMSSICIGTANSSVRQLYLYQRFGFEITDIKKDFFLKHYAEPIYEDGIQAKHMLVLTKRFDERSVS